MNALLHRPGAWISVLGLLCACGASEPPGDDLDLAVLALSAEGYDEARPGRILEFPADHGPHAGSRIEWWYLTANLRDRAGRPYGAHWTLFRFAYRPPQPVPGGNAWQQDQVFMAHMAITTPEAHRGFQRFARGGDHGGVAQAGVRAWPFAAWLDDWVLRSEGRDFPPLELRARQGGYGMQLRLEANGPLVLQGVEGFSQKHPNGSGSHYYSQPFLRAEGELEFNGEAVAVRGDAWLDREWGSRFLQPGQEGWDWFALHLESGEKLMLYRWRSGSEEVRDGAFTYGVLIDPGGGKLVLDPDHVHLEVLDRHRVAGRLLPLRWRILLPQANRALVVEALHADQWMDVDSPYWEGVVLANGEGPENRGRGYMELTGYPRR